MQIYCFNRLDFRIWSRIWFSELLNFSCCSSVPRQRLGDFGNLGSSNDPATKFHTSLGKITYLRLISPSLSSSVLCNPFELFFFYLTVPGIEARAQEWIHTSVHSTPFHTETLTNFPFNLLIAPLLCQPPSCPPGWWNWMHQSQHSLFFLHTNIWVLSGM